MKLLNKQVLIQLKLNRKVLNFDKSFPKFINIVIKIIIKFLYNQGV